MWRKPAGSQWDTSWQSRRKKGSWGGWSNSTLPGCGRRCLGTRSHSKWHVEPGYANFLVFLSHV